MQVRTIRPLFLPVLFALGLGLTARCLRPVSAIRSAIDPAKAEVRLGSSGGFDAYLVHQSDVAGCRSSTSGVGEPVSLGPILPRVAKLVMPVGKFRQAH